MHVGVTPEACAARAAGKPDHGQSLPHADAHCGLPAHGGGLHQRAAHPHRGGTGAAARGRAGHLQPHDAVCADVCQQGARAGPLSAAAAGSVVSQRDQARTRAGPLTLAGLVPICQPAGQACAPRIVGEAVPLSLTDLALRDPGAEVELSPSRRPTWALVWASLSVLSTSTNACRCLGSPATGRARSGREPAKLLVVSGVEICMV